MSSFGDTRWQRFVSFPIRRFRRSAFYFFRDRIAESKWLFVFLRHTLWRIVFAPVAIVLGFVRSYLTHTCQFCRVFMLPLPHDLFSLPLALVLGRRHSCPHCGNQVNRLDRKLFRWVIKEPPIPIILDPNDETQDNP